MFQGECEKEKHGERMAEKGVIETRLRKIKEKNNQPGVVCNRILMKIVSD